MWHSVFTITLHSSLDYYFLEDVSRYVDSTLRERIQSNKHHRDSNRISQQVKIQRNIISL